MINQVINRKTCAFCDSTNMDLVIDFGSVALAGAFLKPEHFDKEEKFPLQVCFCNDCYAVQVVNIIREDILFKNYFYFSSSIKTLQEHFKEYAQEVVSRFLNPNTSTVLEFGCNDGVLLRPLADNGVRTVIGVDPAKNIVEKINDPRVTLINDFFNEEVADSVISEHGKVDMIVANNVYAHIPDIKGITRAIHKTLKDNGVFIFEVHYLGKVISELQYDMIYHEHLYYYSLLSAMNHFSRYGMVIFDVEPVPTHAGSIRFYVCKKSSRHSQNVSERVKVLEAEELKQGYNFYKTFLNFSNQVNNHKIELVSLLEKLNKSNQKVVGYGASGRANTILQFCEINQNHLKYMIDDAPAKCGYYTPGSHLKIYPSAILYESNRPDYLLVFAWSFFDEIKNRNKRFIEESGRMILPLPKVKVFP